MKKLFVLFCIALSGCASYTIFHDNEDCIGTREFKVLQTLDTGALAYECTVFSGCDINNRLVYLNWQPDIEYYDDLVVKVPSHKCAIQNGVYKYTNKQNTQKTVPAIEFAFKDSPKTEEDIAERLEDSHKRISTSCMHDLKLHQEKEDTKFCNCYADQFIDYLVDIKSKEKEFSNTEFNTLVKKKCKKLPKFLEAKD